MRAGRYLQTIEDRVDVSCDHWFSQLQELHALSTSRSDCLSEAQCSVLKEALTAGAQRSLAASILVCPCVCVRCTHGVPRCQTANGQQHVHNPQNPSFSPHGGAQSEASQSFSFSTGRPKQYGSSYTTVRVCLHISNTCPNRSQQSPATSHHLPHAS
jgi:hypothetical protein